ncbi:MAG: toll/interleukin-1 receptor domain-containing protein [Hydrotalea sp.]|nr:toll/interleukin-1 receptor domain-containing protein [Hydrotalea sp.]
MASKYFNINDFNKIDLTRNSLSSMQLVDSRTARGEKDIYDVFLSHSLKDKQLVKQIKHYLENTCNISVYIDWEEDAGTARDDVVDSIKDAIKKSKNLLLLRTENAQDSSWIPWEVGYYDSTHSADRICILLVESDEFNASNFKHEEFLKQYHLLEKDDLIRFINQGYAAVKNFHDGDNRIRAGQYGSAPSFFGDK